MHQTFYIDIDEEITSIVDRLRKSKADEIVIVVPKRALLIQSIVNLKLLKKEAESLKRQIMIVTQDKMGKLLIEKAGILVQQKLDEGLEEVLVFEDEAREKEKVEIEDKRRRGRPVKVMELGTDEYIPKNDSNGQEINLSEKKTEKKKDEFESITNKELVVGISRDIKKKKGIFSKRRDNAGKLDMVKNVKFKEVDYLPEDEIREKKPASFRTHLHSKPERHEQSYSKLEKFFSEDRESVKPSRPSEPDIFKQTISKKFRKIFVLFTLLAVGVILIVGSYLFLPKASVKIQVKSSTVVLDNEIKGDKKISQIDFEKEYIPASEISVEGEFTQSFAASGTKSISNQKAKGKITIYNEYSSTSQDLVATTRFLSEDGKLFRLVSGVTVPGTQVMGSEVKPGVIEAEVAADEPGDAYNIGPTNFTIPGFKDSGAEKYTKFYAKSTGAMTGGGKGNEEKNVITQGDIDNAKKKALSELNSKLKEELKSEAGEGMLIADEAVAYEDAQYSVSNSVGEVSDNFSLTLKSKARALAIRENELKDLISKIAIKKEGSDKSGNSSVSFELGKTDADFNTGEIILRSHSTVKIGPKIDLDGLKKDILGKNEDELEAYLKTYPDIEKIVVDYWPTFITGKIPAYEQRVEVSLDNI